MLDKGENISIVTSAYFYRVSILGRDKHFSFF